MWTLSRFQVGTVSGREERVVITNQSDGVRDNSVSKDVSAS